MHLHPEYNIGDIETFLSITCKTYNIQLPLSGDVNFDHLLNVPDFSTV